MTSRPPSITCMFVYTVEWANLLTPVTGGDFNSILASTFLFSLCSFYFGHTPDIIQAQRKSGNDDISIATIVQQWYCLMPHNQCSPQHTWGMSTQDSPWCGYIWKEPKCFDVATLCIYSLSPCLILLGGTLIMHAQFMRLSLVLLLWQVGTGR